VLHDPTARDADDVHHVEPHRPARGRDAEQVVRLGSSIPARLAYTGLDGDPWVIPVGFSWDGTSIVVGTVPTSAKVPALRTNPRVAITIDTEGYPPHVLLIRGAASVEIVDGVPERYVAASRKIVPESEFAAGEGGLRAMYQQLP
jgi:Pyridoxamine 5'-phosphate oxidase